MSLPAAERLANFAVTITGNPSDDTADGDGESETVGLNAKDWDGTNGATQGRPASLSMFFCDIGTRQSARPHKTG
jgi:hypothetical protein